MYKFNEITLQFIKVHWTYGWLKTIGGYLLLVIVLFGGIILIRHAEMEREIKVIIADRTKFTEEKLVNLIESLHFPFPYIVMAQAIHESSDQGKSFNSKLFLENKNMFGMKRAMSRMTTAEGEQSGYAYYDTWIECVYDRALYSATYLSNIKTEEDYYSYLAQYYAEDPNYVERLKVLIIEKDLKSKFK